jgi:heme A synthase
MEGSESRKARIALGFVRVIALTGVLALSVVVGAILVSSDVEGWIIGLALGAGVQFLTLAVLFSRRFDPPR